MRRWSNFFSICALILVMLVSSKVLADQELVINVSPSPTDDSMTVDLRFFSEVQDVIINWGDGTTSTVNQTEIVSHTYGGGSASYTIFISGYFEGFGWQDIEPVSPQNVRAIDSVTQWNTYDDSPTIKSMEGAFRNHINLQSVPAYLPSTVTNLARTFQGASLYNGNINSWDISQVTTTAYMFYRAVSFNQPLGGWDTSNITNMEYMFHGAKVFNQNIGSWDTRNVTTTSLMFFSTDRFNQDIGSINVDANNDGDFTPGLNGDYTSWDMSNNTSMFSMFDRAMAFNQDLSDWDLGAVLNTIFMFRDSRISVVNYDNLLGNWEPALLSRGLSLYKTGFYGGNASFCQASDPGVEDAGLDCAPNIIRTTLSSNDSDIPAYLTATFSENVTQFNGDELSVNDFVLSISSGDAVINETPSSVSRHENSYLLGIELSGMPDSRQVISVLPVAGAVYDIGSSNIENTRKLSVGVSASVISESKLQWHNRISFTDTYNINSLSLSLINAVVNENTLYSTPILVSGSPIGALTYRLGGSDAEAFTISDVDNVLILNPQDFEAPLDANGDNVYEVTIIVGDEDNNWAERAIEITILPVNEAPLPRSQVVTAIEQTPISILLEGTDEDDAETPILFIITGLPTYGLLTDDGVPIETSPYMLSGSLVYQSTSDSAIEDSFTFNVSDGELEGLSSASVNISITGVNDAPTAAWQVLTATEQVEVGVTLDGIDPDATVLSIFKIIALPTQGILTDSDLPITSVPHQILGNLVYVSTSDVAIVDSFGFVASDGELESSIATVTVDIISVNDAPTANTISVSATEQLETVIELSGSDVDGPLPTIFKIFSLPNFGALSDDSGVISSTPHLLVGTLNYNNESDSASEDSFSFKVNDGELDSVEAGFVSIDIITINDAPVANPMTVTVREQVSSIISLTGSDPDGTTPEQFKIISLPTKGVLSDDGSAIVSVPHMITGRLTYESSSDFDTLDSFTFKVNDGELDSVEAATVSIIIDEVNDAPTAESQVITVTEQISATVNFNGSDPDEGQSLVFKIASLPENGVLKNNDVIITSSPFLVDGELTYTSSSDSAADDFFTFFSFDGQLNSEIPGQVNITIIPVNDAPSSISQSIVVPEQILSNVQLFGTDPDGTTPDIFNILTLPINGDLFDGGMTISVTPYRLEGQLSYQSMSDSALADTFTFNVSDGTLISSNIGLVNLSISGVNDAPIAISQAITVTEQIQTFISLSGTDPDGAAPTIFKIVSLPNEGALTDGGVTITSTPYTVVGALRYQSTSDIAAPDTFSFLANDGALDSSESAQVTINVIDVNDAPVAETSTVLAIEQESVEFNFSGTDADGLPPELFNIVTLPSYGELTYNGNIINSVPFTVSGSLFYKSFSDSATADSLTFQANDGELNSDNIGLVNISITSVNDAPVAVPASYTVSSQESAPVALIGTDPDGIVSLIYRLTSLPTDGQLFDSGNVVTLLPHQVNGDLVYVSGANSATNDSFSFMVNDGELDSLEPALISISIPVQNEAPVAVALSINVTEQVPAIIQLSGTDSDGASPTIFKVTSLPGIGQLVDGNLVISAVPHVIENSLVYQSNSDQALNDYFTFNVNDGLLDGLSDALVAIAIEPVNDAPIASALSYAVIEQVSTTLALAGTDPDGTVPTIFDVISLPSNGSLSDGGAVISAVPHRLVNNLSYVSEVNDIVSDSFFFTVNDGELDSESFAVVSISVSDVNDAPLAISQTISVIEQTRTNIFLTGTDPDGEVPSIFKLVSLPAVGVLEDGDSQIISVPHILSNQLTYTSTSDLEDQDGFSFIVNDGLLDSINSATVSIEIIGENDAPEPISSTVSVVEQEVSEITLTGIDADGDVLTSFKIMSLPTNGDLIYLDTVVTATPLVTEGKIQYLSTSDSAVSDQFFFSVSDGELESVSTAALNISITEVNDAPIANNLALTTLGDDPLLVNLSGTDPDGPPPSTKIITSLPDYGQLMDSNMVVDTVPHTVLGPLFYDFGSEESFSDDFMFKVSDGELESSNEAQVFITIASDNQAPVALAQTATVTEQITASIDLLGTDSNGAPPTLFNITSLPLYGDLRDDGDVIENLPYELNGLLTFTSTSDSATEDSFSFNANDGLLTGEDALVSIVIVGVNDAPLATEQSITVQEKETALVTLSATDPDGDEVSIFKIASLPSHGELYDGGFVISQAEHTLLGDLSYRNTSESVNADSFSFIANDGELDSASPADIVIAIATTNDAPHIIGSLSASIVEGQTHLLNFSHLGYLDIDDQDEGINYSISSLEKGQIQVNGIDSLIFSALELRSNLVTFVHDGTDSDKASFSVSVEDGDEDQSEPTKYVFSYIVSLVDDPPAIVIIENSFIEDSGVLVGAQAAYYTVVDDEGDEVTVSFTNENTFYSLDTENNQVLITQKAVDAINAGDPMELLALTVTENSGLKQFSTASVTPMITLVNDAPVLTVSAGSFTEDDPSLVAEVSIAGSYIAFDEEDDSLIIDFTPGTNLQEHYRLDKDMGQVIFSQSGINSLNLGLGLDVIDITVSPTNEIDLKISEQAIPEVTLVNDLPKIAIAVNSFNEDDADITEGKTAATYTTEDEENDILSVSFVKNSPHYSLDTETNRVLLTQAGAEIAFAGKDLDSLSLIVSEVDDPNQFAISNGRPTVIADQDPGSVEITGIPALSQILEAVVTDDDGISTEINYQWIRDGQVIIDGVSNGYQLIADDVGARITVRATYIDSIGLQEDVTSQPTEIITDLPIMSILSSDVSSGGASVVSTIAVRFQSSSPTRSFFSPDVSVENAILSQFNKLNDSLYSATLTALNDQPVEVNVKAGVFYDLALRDNIASESFTWTYVGEAYAAVLEDVAGNLDGIAATASQINSLPSIDEAIEGIDYSDALANGSYVNAENPQVEEIKAVIVTTNALVAIGLQADSPNIVMASITVAEIGVISNIARVIDDNELAYQAFIDKHPDNFSTVALGEEVQNMVDVVNVLEASLSASLTEDELTVFELLSDLTLVSVELVQIQSLIVEQYLTLSTLDELQNIIDAVLIPVISLLGSPVLDHEACTVYSDDGATAYDFTDGEIPVTVSGGVESNVGIYTLTYSASDADGNDADPIEREVTVVDSLGPEIVLVGDAVTSHQQGQQYIDAGVSASDICDGDVVVEVVGEVNAFVSGSYVLTFRATDSVGNQAVSVTRTVHVADTLSPAITLIGSTPMYHEQGTLFVDPGASAIDLANGEFFVNAIGFVDVDSAGTYRLSYRAVDVAGNLSETIFRDVIVEDTIAPVLTLNQGSEIQHEQGTTFTEPGARAIDAVEGDISQLITVEGLVDENTAGDYELVYRIADSQNNLSSAILVVTVSDTTAPVIQLNGESVINLLVGDTYVELGASVTDTVDCCLDADITITSDLNVLVAGNYVVTYTVSDLSGNEGQATRAVVVDLVPISIVAPEDLVIAASGYKTAVELGAALADDGAGVSLEPTANQVGPFKSGRYEIIWSVTDSNGRYAEATQNVDIIPLVNLGPDTIAAEGNVIDVTVFLSGDAPEYPVSVPFALSGSAILEEDFELDINSTLVIEKGRSGRLTLTVLEDDIFESNETIEITLEVPTNAVLGGNSSKIITLVDENISPQVTFQAEQGAGAGVLMSQLDGLVTVKAIINDANPMDTHTIDWSSAIDKLGGGVVADEAYSLTFDPSILPLGAIYISATVMDSGNPPEDITAGISLKIIDNLPQLSEVEDADGDGISDAQEGFLDDDGDNIPNYLDNIQESYLAPIDDGTGSVMEASEGVLISLGTSALDEGNDITVSEDFILSSGGSGDQDFIFPDNLVDFVLTGEQIGGVYSVIIPVPNGIPDDAVYRKYHPELMIWQEFVENSENEIYSAAGADGACPNLSSDSYSVGLTYADRCILLKIQEGGPNDTDGLANGSLSDPSGLAVSVYAKPSVESSELSFSTLSLVANGTDTATLTAIIRSTNGNPLDGMSLSSSINLRDASVTAFSSQGNGVYTASVRAGTSAGNLVVTVDVVNGSGNSDDYIQLNSPVLSVVADRTVRPPASSGGGGGCTIGVGDTNDATLALMMLYLCLYLLRRRYAVYESE